MPSERQVGGTRPVIVPGSSRLSLYRWAMLVWSVGLCACGMHSARDTVAAPDSEGCPAILLVRRGGLGFESRSGVIAAVWPSGRIVRAESDERPWAQHVVGQLKGEDSLVLQELSNAAWAEPSSEVALDMSHDVLILRRAGETRVWAETPGVTSTPVVATFRRALRDVRVEGARRMSERVEIAVDCRSSPELVPGQARFLRPFAPAAGPADVQCCEYP